MHSAGCGRLGAGIHRNGRLFCVFVFERGEMKSKQKTDKIQK